MCLTDHYALRRMRSLRRQQKDQLERPLLAGKAEIKTARTTGVAVVMEQDLQQE